MFKGRIITVIAASALLSAVAGGACAAEKGKSVDFTVRSEPTAVAPNSGKTLKWDASKGRLAEAITKGQSANPDRHGGGEGNPARHT